MVIILIFPVCKEDFSVREVIRALNNLAGCLEMTNRSGFNNEGPSYFELGQFHQNFLDREPDEVFQMANRVWSNVIINGAVYELQTTFFSAEMTDFDHELVAWFLTAISSVTMYDWIVNVCEKFFTDSLVEDWFKSQFVNVELSNRFQAEIWCLSTLGSSSPGPADDRSLHICFVIAGLKAD